MPELPEVEITRLGILKRVGGRRCTGAVVRETRFRKSAPANLSELLTGQCLRSIERRGKYLIWNFDRGYIVSHLGMSGVESLIPKSQNLSNMITSIFCSVTWRFGTTTPDVLVL